MKKRNQKGFTLVEMLVVVAIIAVLVAVMIPVTGNAITKARAATNAANLRSIQAELLVSDQTKTEEDFDHVKFYAIEGVSNGSELSFADDLITYGGLSAAQWAAVSEGEEVVAPGEGG